MGISDHIPDLPNLKEDLSEFITFPDDGEIQHICNLGDFSVLMWDFAVFTRCSSAKIENFRLTKVNNNKPFKLPTPSPKVAVSLPFFTLDTLDSEVFADVDEQILNRLYSFPVATERQRQDFLYMSLKKHGYDVHLAESTKSLHHYCQFSEGGDFYVTKAVTPPLVIVSPTEVATITADQSTSISDMPSKLSPVSMGQSKLASLHIEAKQGAVDLDRLKYQLWADMIVGTVNKFVKSLKRFTIKDLVALEQLSGFGMACCGDGTFGVYKLEMVFGHSTVIVAKVELGARERLTTAALMDFTLQYYDPKDAKHCSNVL